MKKVKLARLPDRVPVKMQVTRLRDYAGLYAETYGVREEPADLVPFMLESFLRGDAGFRKAVRAKAGKEESAHAGEIREKATSPNADNQRPKTEEEDVRELRNPLTMMRRPDGLSD
jgi:hypothetical protein